MSKKQTKPIKRLFILSLILFNLLFLSAFKANTIDWEQKPQYLDKVTYYEINIDEDNYNIGLNDIETLIENSEGNIVFEKSKKTKPQGSIKLLDEKCISFKIPKNNFESFKKELKKLERDSSISTTIESHESLKNTDDQVEITMYIKPFVENNKVFSKTLNIELLIIILIMIFIIFMIVLL